MPLCFRNEIDNMYKRISTRKPKKSKNYLKLRKKPRLAPVTEESNHESSESKHRNQEPGQAVSPTLEEVKTKFNFNKRNIKTLVHALKKERVFEQLLQHCVDENLVKPNNNDNSDDCGKSQSKSAKEDHVRSSSFKSGGSSALQSNTSDGQNYSSVVIKNRQTKRSSPQTGNQLPFDELALLPPQLLDQPTNFLSDLELNSNNYYNNPNSLYGGSLNYGTINYNNNTNNNYHSNLFDLNNPYYSTGVQTRQKSAAQFNNPPSLAFRDLPLLDEENDNDFEFPDPDLPEHRRNYQQNEIKFNDDDEDVDFDPEKQNNTEGESSETEVDSSDSESTVTTSTSLEDVDNNNNEDHNSSDSSNFQHQNSVPSCFSQPKSIASDKESVFSMIKTRNNDHSLSNKNWIEILPESEAILEKIDGPMEFPQQSDVSNQTSCDNSRAATPNVEINCNMMNPHTPTSTCNSIEFGDSTGLDLSHSQRKLVDKHMTRPLQQVPPFITNVNDQHHKNNRNLNTVENHHQPRPVELYKSIDQSIQEDFNFPLDPDQYYKNFISEIQQDQLIENLDHSPAGSSNFSGILDESETESRNRDLTTITKKSSSKKDPSFNIMEAEKQEKKRPDFKDLNQEETKNYRIKKGEMLALYEDLEQIKVPQDNISKTLGQDFLEELYQDNPEKLTPIINKITPKIGSSSYGTGASRVAGYNYLSNSNQNNFLMTSKDHTALQSIRQLTFNENQPNDPSNLQLKVRNPVENNNKKQKIVILYDKNTTSEDIRKVLKLNQIPEKVQKSVTSSLVSANNDDNRTWKSNPMRIANDSILEDAEKMIPKKIPRLIPRINHRSPKNVRQNEILEQKSNDSLGRDLSQVISSKLKTKIHSKHRHSSCSNSESTKSNYSGEFSESATSSTKSSDNNNYSVEKCNANNPNIPFLNPNQISQLKTQISQHCQLLLNTAILNYNSPFINPEINQKNVYDMISSFEKISEVLPDFENTAKNLHNQKIYNRIDAKNYYQSYNPSWAGFDNSMKRVMTETALLSSENNNCIDNYSSGAFFSDEDIPISQLQHQITLSKKMIITLNSVPSIYYDEECGLDQYANRDKTRRTRFRNLKFPKDLTKLLIDPSNNLLYIWPWTSLMISHGLKYYSPKNRYSYHFERLSAAENGLLLYTLSNLTEKQLGQKNILELLNRTVFPSESIASLKYRIKDAIGIHLPVKSGSLDDKENSPIVCPFTSLPLKKSKTYRRNSHHLSSVLGSLHSNQEFFTSINEHLNSNFSTIQSVKALIKNIYHSNEQVIGPNNFKLNKYRNNDHEPEKYLALLKFERLSNSSRRQLLNSLPYWWSDHIKSLLNQQRPVTSIKGSDSKMEKKKCPQEKVVTNEFDCHSDKKKKSFSFGRAISKIIRIDTNGKSSKNSLPSLIYQTSTL